MPRPDSHPDSVHLRSRAAWRRWLEKNHATARGVWLILDKKIAGRRPLSCDEAVEEALCFGWVDSVVNTVDEARYKQLFSPRKPKSSWSKSNKVRIERLIEQGLMAPAGLEKVEVAKRDGSWTVLDAVAALTIPPDLEQALAANDAARQHFLKFSNSAKKGILWWIQSAKRPETRVKRIAETVALAARNIKANQQPR